MGMGKELDNSKHYYIDPMELEAQLSGLMYNIKGAYKLAKHKNLKIFGSKSAWIKDKERFLTRLRVFIKAPYTAYGDYSTYGEFKELDLPSFLSPYKQLLDVLHSDKALWRTLKLKLIDLYKELENED